MNKHIDYDETGTSESGEKVIIKDRWNREYIFMISSFPLPTGLTFQAREMRQDDSPGYEFNLFCDLNEDPVVAKKNLLKKTKRGINRRHLTKQDGKWDIGGRDMLRGRIAWNDDFSNTKYDRVFVIDGKRITMEEFGEMFERWEGWHFKFKILDCYDSDT